MGRDGSGGTAVAVYVCLLIREQVERWAKRYNQPIAYTCMIQIYADSLCQSSVLVFAARYSGRFVKLPSS